MIEIVDLHKRLGPAWVLRGIDLVVERGEALALGARACFSSTSWDSRCRTAARSA